jgi:hypothetical protein
VNQFSAWFLAEILAKGTEFGKTAPAFINVSEIRIVARECGNRIKRFEPDYIDLCFMKEKEQVGADLYIEDSPTSSDLLLGLAPQPPPRWVPVWPRERPKHTGESKSQQGRRCRPPRCRRKAALLLLARLAASTPTPAWPPVALRRLKPLRRLPVRRSRRAWASRRRASRKPAPARR